MNQRRRCKVRKVLLFQTTGHGFDDIGCDQAVEVLPFEIAGADD